MKRTIAQQGEIEQRYSMPFREVLIYLYNLKGHQGAARELGVPNSTFGYWLLREGVRIIRVAQ